LSSLTRRVAATTWCLAVLGCAWPAAGIAAPALPDPCTIVPVSTLWSTVGLRGVAQRGTVRIWPDGKRKQALCTFKHGDAKVEILIAPHAPLGPFGDPAGTVMTKPRGLGAGATYTYDRSRAFTFASVVFIKGAFDADVWDNGKFSNADILLLARTVFKALP